MYCTECNKSAHTLNVSNKKREEGRCENCGFPMNDRCQRVNQHGKPTDGKGFPKRKKVPYVPRPRRWASA